MTAGMTLDELMTTPYEDIPMEVRHQVLGEAAYYLDRVVETGRISGIKGIVVPHMNHWVVWSKYTGTLKVFTCLAGIWYLSKGGALPVVPLRTLYPRDCILDYIEGVRTGDMLGLSAHPHLDSHKPNDPVWVHDYLHLLMERIPYMWQAYEQLSQGQL